MCVCVRLFTYVLLKFFFLLCTIVTPWPNYTAAVRKKVQQRHNRRRRKPVLPWLQPWHCCQQSRVPRLLSLYIPPRTVLHQRLIRRLNLNQRMENMLLLYVTWTKCSKIEKRQKKNNLADHKRRKECKRQTNTSYVASESTDNQFISRPHKLD